MNSNLENIRCNLCGVDNTHLLFNKDSYNVVKCRICGLAYVNPRLSQDKTRSLYDEQYFHGKGFDKSINYYRDFIERPVQEIEECKLRLEEIRKYKSQGKLLDVGCAFGLFMEIANEQGWDSYGVELSSYAANFAFRKFKEKVLIGELDSDAFTNGYFDVVTMVETIEHFPDPIKTLKQAYRVLSKRGIIFIQTGNIESFRAKLAGKKWNYLTLPGHIYYFSPKTIRKYLEIAGFRAIRIIPPSDHERSRLLMRLKTFRENGSKIARLMGNLIYPLAYRLVSLCEIILSQGMKVIAYKEHDN